jgi:hypothetical protein
MIPIIHPYTSRKLAAIGLSESAIITAQLLLKFQPDYFGSGSAVMKITIN